MKISSTLGLASMIALAATQLGCPSGGIGDPCTPEEEYRENFAGFSLTEENIESRSFQCRSRICLVNHFQGRVSCPAGQDAPHHCDSDAQCQTALGEHCEDAGVVAPPCDPTPCGDGVDANNCNLTDGTNPACGGRVCDQQGRYCKCAQITDCPAIGEYSCEAGTGLCKTKVCSKPGQADRCYLPGSDIPVNVEVCGQCTAPVGGAATRDAENAVYCSCRCGVAEGEETDEDFNFCDCPSGFVCEEIRKNVGLGDKQITGKFCIKEGTKWDNESQCGKVQGHYAPQCAGNP
ncbi:MAG: hypothetical protein IT373_04865 [Polyangiaceae bacterium]|nr:hypothetical protein [Polyangiaceae bacterium]